MNLRYLRATSSSQTVCKFLGIVQVAARFGEEGLGWNGLLHLVPDGKLSTYRWSPDLDNLSGVGLGWTTFARAFFLRASTGLRAMVAERS